MLSTVVAYVLVIALVQFCLTGGMGLLGVPVALLLVRAPVSFRTTVAGLVGGIAGVGLAVAFGYGVFRLVVGPDSFALGPFLASTVPLLVPIWNDWVQFRRVAEARREVLDMCREAGGTEAVAEMAEETKTAYGSSVAGELIGLSLATIWFFSR